jgi:ATPase subunit of ABC transporter with duplicated ATPase domains
MITITSLAKSYGVRTLFAGVSLHLNDGERYGLVGANGSGKTTFLRILAGETAPTEGEISLPRRARVGVLDQDHFRYEHVPILDAVVMGNRELWEAARVKEEVLARAHESFDAARYAAAEDVFTAHDGYAFEARAAEILEGLGIPGALHREPLSVLSGGFKLRVLLAQTLAADPDVLLLDEPTNHLDIVSIRWLETFLAGFAGCAVVISHDHRFLDHFATRTLDVDYETITEYPGNYSDFVEGKQSDRERREAEIEKREKEIAGHMAFVERFRAKASKARQAQSKLKKVERIEIETLPKSSRRYPTFRFAQRRPSGKVAVEVAGIAKAFGENRVLEDVTLTVGRGERVAIIGPNGIGKSTLLKILVGRLEPDAGEVRWGYEARPGYFAQDHHEAFGEGTQSAAEWLHDACPGQGIGFVMSRLGLVLLGGEEAAKRVGRLSGGEAARLVFARLAVEQPNVLVLDEPTNHLDLEGVESLVEGLKGYDGTIVLVSHDRWFVQELADRIIEIRPDGITDYRGDYAAYVHHCGDDHLDVDVAARPGRAMVGAPARDGRQEGPAGGPVPVGPALSGAELHRRRKHREALAVERDRLEADIVAAEARIAEIDALFTAPGDWDATPREEARVLEDERARLIEEVERGTARWAQVEEEIAGLDANPSISAAPGR